MHNRINQGHSEVREETVTKEVKKYRKCSGKRHVSVDGEKISLFLGLDSGDFT